MSLFKKAKPAPRVVKITQGYVPQVYFTYGYEGIDSTGQSWLATYAQAKYCVQPSRKEANTILEDYLALTTY
jgi:hypothetical protein